MPDIGAEVKTEFEFSATLRGNDGYELHFVADDSLRSWWAIVRWNWHYKHWGPLAANARDLFTMILWRKVRTWRR